MADTGGVNIVVTPDTAQAVAQRLVCWDRTGGVSAQSVVYRTDGNRPYFRIPAGSCAGKPTLTLTPDGDPVACPASGTPTHLQPTLAEVSGLAPDACSEIAPPTALAVTGTPTGTAVVVHWTAPATGPTPTGYRLAHRVHLTGQWIHAEIAAGTLTATTTGLTVNTNYDWHVQARHDSLLSPATADVAIATATS